MPPTPHQAASAHLPWFITAPGQTDVLTVLTGLLLIGAVLAVGVFFFWLHSLPERMVHNKVQFDIVAVLALISLFTHIHAFWVAALLLALVDLPKFSLPHFASNLERIATSAEKIANSPAHEAGTARDASTAMTDQAVTQNSAGKSAAALAKAGIGSSAIDTAKAQPTEHGA